jgi:hypothetical protein
VNLSADEDRPLDYGDELRRLADERQAAVARADRAASEIAQSLPGALAGGLSVVRASEITGISRPTLYRMLNKARQHEEIRDVAARFEQAVEQLSNEHELSPRPYDLGTYLGLSIDEVFEALAPLYGVLTAELESYGSAAITTLIGILPSYGPPEDPILKMLLLHRASPEKVAWSTKRPQVEVFGWAVLGLLRALPHIRRSVRPIEEDSIMSDTSLPASEDALGWDAVSMQKLWDESNIPVRRLLQHLYCHPDTQESAASIDDYVKVGTDGFRLLVDNLTDLCTTRYSRPLPFARWADQSIERLLMPRAVTELLHIVI